MQSIHEADDRDEKHLFDRRHYNALADIMQDVLLTTKPEHLEAATSLFLRVANGMAMKSSNMQVGRFMSAAGIPNSASTSTTKLGS